MPWKNGQGTTHEIWVERDAQDTAGSFRFRLSIATVQVASPFSRFPGCDRTILLLDGEGMCLDSGPGRQHRLEQPHEPYAFSGDWDTDCTLIGGPCRDFNVMVDRRRARAEVRVISLPAGTAQGLTPQPDDTLWALFTLAGTMSIRADTPTTLPALTLPPEHTLVVRGEDDAPLVEGLRLQFDGADSKLLWIALRRPA
jgi:environmental stress-induced protein Ves